MLARDVRVDGARVDVDAIRTALPDGAVVVQRARDSLALADREVAPAIDWAEAARRVAQVDAGRG